MDRRKEASVPQLPDHSFFLQKCSTRRKAEARREAMLQHLLLPFADGTSNLINIIFLRRLEYLLLPLQIWLPRTQISKILLSSILLSFLFFFFLHPNLCRKGSLPLTLLQEWTWSKAVECKCNSTSTSGFVCHEFYTTNVQGRKGWQFYTVSVPNDDVYEYFDLLLSRGYYKLL